MDIVVGFGSWFMFKVSFSEFYLGLEQKKKKQI